MEKDRHKRYGTVLVRIGFLIYGALLTMLLAVPRPWALLGIDRPPGMGGARGVHFVFFAVLAVLFCASRWPMRLPAAIVSLTAYALTVELLQAIVPGRTVEVADLGENLLGLLVGSALCWCTARRGRRRD